MPVLIKDEDGVMSTELTKYGLSQEVALKFVGDHGGCHDYTFAFHFDVGNSEARAFLEELYYQGKVVIFVTPKCECTGENLLAQKLEGIFLDDYVYKCEDMDGECCFCGEEHHYRMRDLDPFFVLHKSLGDRYPRKSYRDKKQEQIDGLITQIGEMHELIESLRYSRGKN